MLARSSNRACSSTTAVTCFPEWDALISAATIGLSIAGAVEGLLDGQHVGVGGRLLDEGLDRGGERLVGVVHQDVTLGQHREEVAVTGQLRRHQRGPRFGGQVGAVDIGQHPQAAEVDGHVGQEDIVLGDVDGGDEEVEQFGRDAAGHLEPDGLAEPTPVQLELDGGQQVLGVVLVDREVGVAGDPEGVVLGHRHVREERVRDGRR